MPFAKVRFLMAFSSYVFVFPSFGARPFEGILSAATLEVT